jgi:pyruvate kinase
MTHLWITLGPSSLDREAEFLRRGATGVRLTFSYGTPELQLERARHLRKIASEVGRPCLIVADLAGEKFRLGGFAAAPSIPVEAGMRFTLAEVPVSDPAAAILPVPENRFLDGLTVGDVITVGDGGAELAVVATGADGVVVQAVVEGTLQQFRGLTVRGGGFNPRALTDKDRADLEFVVRHEEFDAVALSFVSSSSDLAIAHEIMGARRLPVIAKIETARGVERIEEISRGADMVMAARGDLALSIPWVDLPAAVTAIADAAARTGTPWILATQVAEGLERFTLPTRAEICDLAHWLNRGCSGVMLSYETVFGGNALAAVESVEALVRRWGTSPDGIPAVHPN